LGEKLLSLHITQNSFLFNFAPMNGHIWAKSHITNSVPKNLVLSGDSLIVEKSSFAYAKLISFFLEYKYDLLLV
jgi:hypothetical protein